MPKNKNIKKVLVIGSGPIIIGQAAEFDYAGTQACEELKKEGIEVVLVNSNPATIMTDKNMADKIYIEPLTKQTVKKILSIEKPDSILPNLGGQTGLNIAMELYEEGFLQSKNIRLLGTSPEGIKKAEDRQEFKDTMEKIGEPCIASKVVTNYEAAKEFANKIGLPVIVRPAYTLGGTGGGIAYTIEELEEIAKSGLQLSRVHQILIEKCISGWKEIEYEVMRDKKGNCITICNMENIDPVGVHTGDSIVVAPSQTLADKEYQMLRTSAIKIISELKIEGGCNVQFALNPSSFEYAVIEVNPRVSRSSALASKATGYPIAKVSSKIAIGYTLDEIKNDVTKKTYACFEPVLDYVIVKIPKWPFKKFTTASRDLGTQMKATGEVMAIATSIEAGLMKAIRSLEENLDSLILPKLEQYSDEKILAALQRVDNERIWVIAEAIRRRISIDKIHDITTIDKFFISKIQRIINVEEKLKTEKLTIELLRQAKKMGYTDELIGKLSNRTQEEIKNMRVSNNIVANFKMVDTCAAEFEAQTPYYYSSYEDDNEVKQNENKQKILVLGSGPIRIGQGIEFDYCSVHCVWALKQKGYETIIVNNNPETVSTDFDIADKLYFEPLTKEDVENIVNIEKPIGAIVQFGGQTAIKLTRALTQMGVKILGTQEIDMDRAEDRELFDKALENCGIPRPKGETIFTEEEGIKVANELKYPVLVRPSYVLGGQGMAIAYDDQELIEFISQINKIEQEHPILIDKYMSGKEVEVDAIFDGEDILIPGIMEHLERAGVHSGDSISVYPTQHVSLEAQRTIIEYTKKIAKELNIIGVLNIQFIINKGNVYIIEVNPRSSRTVPYISKVTNLPVIDVATRVILGEKLKDMEYGIGIYKKSEYISVKMPIFSFEKIKNADTSLGPEMKSTGEVLGISKVFSEAMLKGFLASGINIPYKGSVLITVKDKDKIETLPIAKKLESLGLKIYATSGTAQFLNENGVEAEPIVKIWEGEDNIINLIQEGKINFIINTPTKGKNESRDGFKIRRLAVESKIPCFTSLDTVSALYEALEKGVREEDLEPIDITKI
ncbi:MAG: carbamoyl-phosphate synthase large subunit [Clostridia bacterium]|jgi:carbamoyl-phosphate synthase large subunit|nr:carbamoyl-phosphate synthase large subunit [Clostridia bacterium]